MLKNLTILFFIFSNTALMALEPQISTKGKLLYSEDFSQAFEVGKPRWWIKQNTRWSVQDGVLVGIPATLDYQKKKKDIGKGHLGDIPRIGLGKMPKSYIMSFKFQVDDKAWNSRVPMFEFGHHITRIFFTKEGAKLLSDHEKVEYMKDENLILKPFVWYEVLAEVAKEDLNIQIKDESGKITNFNCHYPKFKDAPNTSFQIASTIQGTLKLDDVKFWETK